MATLPVNSISSALMYFKRSSSSDSISVNAPRINAKTIIKTSSVDSVDLNTNHWQDHDIFASYIDLLQQQRRSRALINQNLSAFGQTSTGQNSVLNTYQTLEYQQNTYDRMYNLKGTLFQSSLNISV